MTLKVLTNVLNSIKVILKCIFVDLSCCESFEELSDDMLLACV